MANEITYSMSLRFAKGNVVASRSKSSASVTVSGVKFVGGVQNIGTAAEAIDLGDIGTPGWAIFQNMDATNYLEIGHDNAGFEADVRLNAGEWAMFRMTQAAPQARANTGAVNMEYYIIEA